MGTFSGPFRMKGRKYHEELICYKLHSVLQHSSEFNSSYACKHIVLTCTRSYILHRKLRQPVDYSRLDRRADELVKLVKFLCEIQELLL